MHRVNDTDADQTKPRDLPHPKLARMRWPFPLIWLVPICALARAGYYYHLHHEEHGTEITVRFKDASGLQPTQTPVTIHGVEIGRVKSLELGEDRDRALVHITLERKYASLASEGALSGSFTRTFRTGTSAD